MTLNLSKEDINHLIYRKRINNSSFKKMVYFFKKEITFKFINETVNVFKDRLPCNRLETSYLKKAIGFNYLALLLHDELLEIPTSNSEKLQKNKLNILYGDLLIIESIYYINKIKNKLVRDFFFSQAKEIINAQLHLNINVFLKSAKKNSTENHLHLQSLLKKNWLTFSIALLIFLEKEKLNNQAKKEIHQLINNLNLLYLYNEELLFLQRKWFFSKLTSMHFYLKKNHSLIFNKMLKGKKEDIPQKITLAIKSNLEKKINQLSKSLLNNELSSKFFLENFSKSKKQFVKKIALTA